MNSFGSTLQQILFQENSTKLEIGEAAKIDSATMSRLTKGTLDPSPKVLRALCHNASKDPNAKAQLLIARLEDIIEDSGLPANLVKISQPSLNEGSDFEDVPVSVYKTVVRLAQIAAKIPEMHELMQANIDLYEASAASKNENMEENGDSILKLSEDQTKTMKEQPGASQKASEMEEIVKAARKKAKKAG
ncbi:hypothetical protein [Rubellicoccus peritrichatus]|uniref:Uncharacterized protein n=1 Tax=Rubellicoccus peritrichatus TaxID=3080537 RepID=A0AAQ3LCF9_9BACT|nr:hypothetical protein [Puniceicoccus sp. CR14]WOO43130.1 hypothetical protein RZN69_08495 [Puniceicoccus sp. CR14]